MSLILEALRKSEAERQRGRSPGLFVQQRATPARAQRTPTWAWGVAVLAAAALLAWAWQAWAPVPADGQSNTPPAPPAAAPSPPAAPPPPALPPITLAPRALPSPSVTATPPVEAAPVVVAPAAVPVPAPAPLPLPAAPAPPAQDLSYVPGLETLPSGERAALPPLKLSMHVYAVEPGQRFVILDGQRLVEGASPAAGVVLEEIRRDGLLLSINGQRLLLARP